MLPKPTAAKDRSRFGQVNVRTVQLGLTEVGQLNNPRDGFEGCFERPVKIIVQDAKFKVTFFATFILPALRPSAISRWNYKADASSLQHVGPMAQDFHAAFGFNGNDDKHLSAVDVQGVALAAIQGLNQKLETENAALRSRLSTLEQRLIALERK